MQPLPTQWGTRLLKSLLESFISATCLLLIRVLFLAAVIALLLGFHVSKAPGQLQIDAGIAVISLVAPEGGAFSIVFKLAAVEHVAPIQCQCQLLVEEGLANTQVQRDIGLA